MVFSLSRSLSVVLTSHVRSIKQTKAIPLTYSRYGNSIIHKRFKHDHVGVLSAPFHLGQRREGVKDGPTIIKETGVLSLLNAFDVKMKDYGVVPVEESDNAKGPHGERNHVAVLEYNRKLSSAVSNVIKEGGLCLTLGGDHSIAIGTINGHAEANPDHQVVVLWIDAHADINTGESSNSGNMHGMPVAHHLKELYKQINPLPDDWPKPCMSAEHIAYIGLRDVDEFEKKLLKDLGILAYGIPEIDELGIQTVLKNCLEKLQPSETRPLHLSFDIDAFDPRIAPSTGTVVREGLTLNEGVDIMEAAKKTGHLKAIDIVEVNPELGSDHDADLTANVAKIIMLGAVARI